jgi:hypothetical protein
MTSTGSRRCWNCRVGGLRAGEPSPAPDGRTRPGRLRTWCHSKIVYDATGEPDRCQLAAIATILSRRPAVIEATFTETDGRGASARGPQTPVPLPADGARQSVPLRREAMK